jgi:hypothetical protein
VGRPRRRDRVRLGRQRRGAQVLTALYRALRRPWYIPPVGPKPRQRPPSEAPRTFRDEVTVTTKNPSDPPSPPPSVEEGSMEWVQKQLDALLGTAEERMRKLHESCCDGPDAYEVGEAEIENFEPLKKKYPHLAKFFRKPKMRRGQNSKQFDPRLEYADSERDEIITFLDEHRHLLPVNIITPPKVIAARWGVKPSQVSAKQTGSRLARRVKADGGFVSTAPTDTDEVD